jgi:hypothetical protein
MLQTFDAR